MIFGKSEIALFSACRFFRSTFAWISLIIDEFYLTAITVTSSIVPYYKLKFASYSNLKLARIK